MKQTYSSSSSPSTMGGAEKDWFSSGREEDERELNLRLNKNQGEWDVDLIASLDSDLLVKVGWDDEEIDNEFYR